MQRTVADSSGEIVQLKEAVSTLRESLEKNQFEYETTLHENERLANDEQKQLRDSIAALREKLEEKSEIAEDQT